jgi:poly [ADP-ribose] polymerase
MSLSGKIICFTGTLSTPRAECKAKAEAAGAKVGDSVTGKTNILICGPGAGSKMEAAKAKGVEIWTEDEFLASLGGGKASSASPAAAAAPAAVPKKAAKGKAAAAAADEEAPSPAAAAAAPKGKGKGKAVAAPVEEEAPMEVEAVPKGKGKKRAAKDDASEAPEPAKVPKAAASAKAPAALAAAPAVAAAAATPAAGGAARPDRLIPSGDSYKIYQDYTTKLMQTNIGGNNNKFYIAQVLQNGGSYALWTRWGRLGEDGQNQLQPAGGVEEAIKAFEKKFKDKTKNNWADRGAFVKKDDQYQLVETADDDDGAGGDDAALGRFAYHLILRVHLLHSF